MCNGQWAMGNGAVAVRLFRLTAVTDTASAALLYRSGSFLAGDPKDWGCAPIPRLIPSAYWLVYCAAFRKCQCTTVQSGACASILRPRFMSMEPE